MPYLVDADWIIQALAGRSRAAATLSHLAPQGLSVSLVTVAEVYEVAFSSVHPHAYLEDFRQFLAPLRLLTLNEPIIEHFAEIRAFLRRRGDLISDFDILLGATALHYDLTVLTFNIRHLQRIPDLKLYEQG